MKATAGFLVAFFGFLALALDQFSKALVVSHILPGQIIHVIPGYFNLTLTFNRGAAFGLLADLPDGQRQILLAGLTVVALGVVVWLLLRDYRGHAAAQFALAIIIGGALGNVIDRVRLGHVIDFLDFYYGYSHWPAFNVADSAICVGVLLLFFISFRGRRKPRPKVRKPLNLRVS